MKKNFPKDKITGSHSSAIEAAIPVLKKADKIDEVTKISLGIIKVINRANNRSIKFSPIIGGIRAVVRGNISIQEIYIYTESPDHTEGELKKAFEEA